MENSEERYIDVVCGAEVTPGNPTIYEQEYEGETYYFCSRPCIELFEQKPTRYLGRKSA